MTPPRYEAGGQCGGHPRGPPPGRGRAGGGRGGVESQPAYGQLAREPRDVLELRPLRAKVREPAARVPRLELGAHAAAEQQRHLHWLARVERLDGK
mgnify:CR=1 FL=1